MTSGKDTIFFYVNGSDLHEVAGVLRARLRAFVHGRTWVGDAWFVDDVHEEDPSLKPGDLPDWNLGINIAFENPPQDRPPSWFEDVAATIRFLQTLARETGRSFVIGGSFEGSEVAEDLFEVEAESEIDLERVRFHLGG